MFKSAYQKYLYSIVKTIRAIFDFRFDGPFAKSEGPFSLAFHLVEFLVNDF